MGIHVALSINIREYNIYKRLAKIRISSLQLWYSSGGLSILSFPFWSLLTNATELVHSLKAASKFNLTHSIGGGCQVGSLVCLLVFSFHACLCFINNLCTCLAISVGLEITPSILTLFPVIHSGSKTVVAKSWKFLDSHHLDPNRFLGLRSFSPNLILTAYV